MNRVVSIFMALALVLVGVVAGGMLELDASAAALGTSSTVTVPVELLDGTIQNVAVTAQYDLAKAVVPLINEARAKEGKTALGWYDALEGAAIQRAAEFSTDHTLAHTRPNGEEWITVLEEFDIAYGDYGENLAAWMKTSEIAVEEWMKSTGHRNTLMDGKYKSTAVAAVIGEDGRYYWVQLFSTVEGIPVDGGDPGTTDPTGPVPKTYIVAFNSNYGASVASQRVKEGDLVARPSDPTRSSYTFGGWYSDSALTKAWNFTTDTVSGNITLYAKWVYRGSGNPSISTGTSAGGSGSSSSSKGSSSVRDTYGAGSSTALTGGGVAGSNVNSDGSVASSIKGEVEKAVAASVGNTATVRVRDAGSIAVGTLNEMVLAAKGTGKTVTMYADTMNGDSVQGRLYVEPSRLSRMSGSLQLGVYTQASRTGTVKAKFEAWFSNKVAVVHLEQQNSFPAEMRVAAKIDLKALDTGNLVFYSYNRTTNAYSRISNPRYSIDSNGYLHFYTQMAGDIVITDSVLVKK